MTRVLDGPFDGRRTMKAYQGLFRLTVVSIMLYVFTNLFTGCTQKPPTIVQVNPITASATGGTEITITGTGFKATPIPIVEIGGNFATDVKVIDKKTLKAKVPPWVAGPVDIVVQDAHTNVKSLRFKGFSYYEGVNNIDTPANVRANKIPKNIVSKYDNMEDITWYHTEGYDETEQGETSLEELWKVTNVYNDSLLSSLIHVVNIYAYIGKDSTTIRLRCICKIYAESWLFIDKIIFLVDGKRIEWSFDSTAVERDVLDGYIREYVDFNLDRPKENDMLTIARGKDVEVRFSGEKSHYDYTLTTKQKQDLLAIVSYYEVLKQNTKTVE